MPSPTFVQIDLDALDSNLREIQKFIRAQVAKSKNLHPKNPKILGLVKADAYGHGLYPIAQTCLSKGINSLGVARVEEALELRKRGLTSPILILGPFTEEAIPTIVRENLTPAISSLDMLDLISREAGKNNSRVKVHLKIDTGLSRYGFLFTEARVVINKIFSFPNIEIEGCFTHFAESEKLDSPFTNQQMENFQRVLHTIRTQEFRIPLIHSANSAAVLSIPESYFDMVRPGLILYGLYPSPSFSDRIKLTPVLSWKTRISRLQSYPRHTSVGYARTFISNRDSLIGTIPVGYGDGYSRLLSNRGFVLARGKRARIVGNISMDLTTIDVTDIPGVSLGDEVVLIGKQDDQGISVDELANIMGTISYEVLCLIGKRVPRIYFRNSEPVNF